MATACRRRSGLKVSPGDLLQHVDVERLVCDELLQPGVLTLELSEPAGVVGAELPVSLAPAVVGLLGDLQALEHRGKTLPWPMSLSASWSFRTTCSGVWRLPFMSTSCPFGAVVTLISGGPVHGYQTTIALIL